MKESAFQKRIADVGMKIVKNKVWVILALLVVVGISGAGLSSMRMDNSMEGLLPQNSPAVADNEAFEEIFGKRDIVFVLVESDDIFSHETFAYIDNVSRDLEENLPFATDVVSLTQMSYIDLVDDTLRIENLLQDGVPQDPAALADIRSKVMGRPSLVDMLITADEKATGIFIIIDDLPSTVYADVPANFDPVDQSQWEAKDILMRSDVHLHAGPGLNAIDNPPSLLAPAVEVILDRHAVPSVSTVATGMHLVDFYGDVHLYETAGVLVMLTLVISTLLMVFLTRSIRPVIGTFLVIVLGLVTLIGLQSWLGITLSMVSLAVPVVLMMVLSVGYSIHIVNHFKTGVELGYTRLQAVRYAYAEATWPVFISALTSALGFISFMLVPIEPIRVVGAACAAGSFLTYIMVILVVPISLAVGRDRVLLKGGAQGQMPGFQKAMVNWANLVTRRPVTILVFAMIFMVLMGYNALSIRTNPDTMEMAGDKVDFIRDARYAIERLGAMYTYDVFIELPEPDMGRTSAVLQAFDQLQADIETMPGTVNTGSLANLVKEMNLVMNGNDLEHYQVPASDALTAQYLLLYEMAGGDGLDGYVDFDYQQMRLNVQISQFSGELFAAFKAIETRAEQLFPPGTEVSIVGQIPMLLESVDLLTSGNVRSLFTAIAVITLVMMFVLKSVRLGLLSMIPNALPIVAALGFMALTDKTLDFFTVMVTPMILGIAVDDTVHYFVHFKEEFDKHGCYLEANRENFRKIGRALIFTTIIIVAGFATLTMIQFAGFQNMAIVAGFGIAMALLGDMLVAPALTMAFKPFGKTAEAKAPAQASLIKKEA